MRTLGGVLPLLLLGAVTLAAQQPTAAASREGCRFRLDSVGGLGRSVVVGFDTNYYASGFVRLICSDSSARISSDSVAVYGRGRNTVADFVGHVRYDDSITTQTAERGTYYRNGDRWEARGSVATKNLKDGSTIQGPSLDYYRSVRGVRDTIEMFAIGRPTIHSYPRDSTETTREPYVIVADRVRMKGNDQTWAGGMVTIDRSDFSARSDSLYLNSGPANEGRLIGTPIMRGLGKDSFELHGRRIDLTLDRQAIKAVRAVGQGHAISKDLDLVGDTIHLNLENKKLVQTLAWGDSIKPLALAADYQIRGDSVAFDTPDQRLRQVRAFRRAWAGGKVDSITKERDWLSGDTVIASFTTFDSAGTSRSTLSQLIGSGSAHSYYRLQDKKTTGIPSINYTRGDRITVRMKTTGQRGVDRVKIDGHVDGVHLKPAPPPADTTAGGRPARGKR